MKKKILALIMMLTLSVMLFSCGKSEQPAGDVKEDIAEVTEEAVEQEEETAQQEAENSSAQAEEPAPELDQSVPYVDNTYETIDTSKGVTGAPSKNAFDINDASVLEDDGFTVYIPSYWGDDQGSEGQHQYYAEVGNSVTILQISFMDYPGVTWQTFETEDKIGLYDAFMQGTGIENPVQKSTLNGGRYFEAELSNVALTGEVDTIYNPDKGRLIMIVMMSSKEAEYDYYSDYSQMLKSIVLK